jgi:hypothetical protein
MQNNSDINKFLSELDLENVLNVEEDLGEGFVKLRISEAERRQALQDIKSVEDIVIELLRNSRDAKAKNIFLGTKKNDHKRIINIIDDGIGIPIKLKDLIFESRVTSKLENATKDPYGFHGRGMALFSIRLNVEKINLQFSQKNKGCAFFIEIDLNKVREKKDQSLLPQIIINGANIELTGGVANIIKTLFDFKINHPEINIYHGSPIQILNAMRMVLKNNHKFEELPKFDDWDQVVQYVNENDIKTHYIPSLTNNYLILEKISKFYFNMDISDRGLQRIIYDEIKCLDPLHFDMVDKRQFENDDKEISDTDRKNAKNNKLILYDEQNLSNRFQDEEIRNIILVLKNEFEKIGKRYFLTLSKDIEINKENNIINLVIEFKEKE